MALTDWINWARTNWQVLAFASAAIIGTSFVGYGGCSFYNYLGDKTKEERKEEPKQAKANLEQRVQKDNSWKETVDENGRTWFQFYEGNGISAETFYGFEKSGTALQITKGEVLVGLRNAYRKEIGDREFTGAEKLQIMRLIDNENNVRNIGIITDKEAIGASDKIKNAKNDEEIRAAFPIKCDAPYFIPCGADTETSYQDAVNAARAEYKAAEKLSALTARGYEGARRTDEWNRQREQARMSALWDLRRQPRRR